MVRRSKRIAEARAATDDVPDQPKRSRPSPARTLVPLIEWFDADLARQLWTPATSALRDVPRLLPIDYRIVDPLLGSWFEVGNYAETTLPAPWQPPPRPPSVPAAAAAATKRSGKKTKASTKRKAPTKMKRTTKKGKSAARRSKRKTKRPKKKKKLPANSMFKLRLYPSTDQRQKLEHMFSTSRAIYNKLVGRSLDECAPHTDEASGRSAVEELQRKYRTIMQASKLAKFFQKKKSRAWHGAVYQEVRESAFRDFIKAVRSSRALYFALREQGKDTTYPVLSFKSKFARSDTIELRARAFTVMNTGVRFHPAFFGFEGMESITIKETKLPPIDYSVRLQRLREGQYYLMIPRRQEWTRTTERRVCAIDPGVRNFVTVYDSDGRTVSVKDAFAVIKRRFDAIDKMKSTLAKMDNECKKRHKKKVRTKRRVLRDKIRRRYVPAHNRGRRHHGRRTVWRRYFQRPPRYHLLRRISRRLRHARRPHYCQVQREQKQEQLRMRRQRYRLRRGIRFTNRRVTRMIADMHNRVASWLAANYRCVLLPTFQTSEMVRRYDQEATADGMPPSSPDEHLTAPSAVRSSEREHTTEADTAPPIGRRHHRRKIRSPTARAMLSQAHYKFRMLLTHKMARVGGAVVLCGEEYTSKTCSACGAQNHALGASSVFHCDACGSRADRDVNAARNIFIKNWQMLR